MVQTVNKEREKTAENEVLELDSDLEERICMLWDMSSNKDIAHFLLENRAVEIFLEIINMTVSPRLVEIIIGILGNMVFYEDICEHITRNDKLIEQVVQLVGSTDPPILVQVIRLIHVCTMNEVSSAKWIDTIKRNNNFILNLTFILKSSLNGELLKGTLKLIYCILDKEMIQSEEWNMQEIIGVVVESGKQLLNLKDFKALDEFWHTIYFLIQQENINNSLDEHLSDVCQIFNQYVLKQKENENSLPDPNSVTAVAAAISVAVIFLHKSKCDDYHSLITGQTLRYIEQMLGAVKKIISKKETTENDKSVKSDENISNPVQTDSSVTPDHDLEHLYILHDSLKEISDFMISPI